LIHKPVLPNYFTSHWLPPGSPGLGPAVCLDQRRDDSGWGTQRGWPHVHDEAAPPVSTGKRGHPPNFQTQTNGRETPEKGMLCVLY